VRPHLNNDEIEQLFMSPRDSAGQELANETVQADALEHLRACESCQMKLRVHRELAEGLARLRFENVVPRTPQCPSESVWVELAAGLPLQNSGTYLDHAAQCEHCGPLLRQASGGFDEQLTPDDERLLSQLRSPNPEWQRDLARKLRVSSQPRVASSRWTFRFTLPRLAFAVGLTSIVALVLWVSLSLSKSPSPDRLLAQAYAEKRTVEMRIEGAPYAPLSQDRGADTVQNRMNRPALLRAESEIAQRLKSNPDDTNWLHARGRASLLEADGEAAIASLEKARQLAPNDESISTDLASAYFQRGESLNRPEDCGRTVDILGKVLAADPANEVARFNYAIALERISLYQQAIEQWQTFLTSYPTSGWAAEARGRLSQLQEKVRQHQKQSQSRMYSATEIAGIQQDQREESLDKIDARAEGYLGAAIIGWLPAAFASNESASSSSRSDRLALVALAETLRVRHGDRWLPDLLKANRHSPRVQEAFKLVADVERLIEISDNDRAAKEAQQAASLFKNARVPAGELYARFQVAYAAQLSHRNGDCSVIANDLLHSREIGSYSWLHIQAEIESAICASTSDEKALASLREASFLATQHHYPNLRSRTAQVLSAIYWTLGDTHESWEKSTDGLREYWAAGLPPLRGYNLLTNLDYLANDEQQWFLQAVVLRESVPIIAADPDQAMRAFEQARLGQALLMTGDLTGAEASFRETQRLFKSVPDGSRRNNLAAESELGLAKIDIQRGLTEKAVARLGAIQQKVSRIPDDDLALEFFQTYGLALLRAGSLKGAEENLASALELAEKGLPLIRGERDRLKWSRRNGPTYRAMVDLKLREDPRRALAYWEWYKGASLREQGGPSGVKPVGPPRDSGDSTRTIATRDGVTLVSFFLLQQGTVVWVSDAAGTQESWIAGGRDKLESLAQRFSERCSEPNSSLENIRREGAELYRQLVLPIEPLIRGRHALVIEPDGALNRVPFVALVDRDGQYLGDRYAISISPGFTYESDTRQWRGVFPQSRALVVGSPTAPGWPPLPDAEREARSVAEVFQHARLLLRTEATYPNIARELPDSDVFHFSGHAKADPNAAGVVVNGSDLFDVSKLDQLHLYRTQLVVLSACSSARGTAGLFDDEDSLVRRLITAGVPEVIASRWTVDSVATATLMHDFYARLLGGGTVADSMSLAVKDLRTQDGYSHPFYWAGFTVFGRG
jgi:CHAT domain-containing protein/cytochrome c-type biogenesis protein CcmH/NrfG